MARKTEAELRQQLGIPAGAQVTVIDLDETKTVEEKLHGWTDDMIRAKSLEDFDALIKQRELAVTALQDTIETERVEIEKLRQVKARRKIL